MEKFTMAQQKEDNNTIDIFHDDDKLKNFLKKKIDQNMVLEQMDSFEDKDQFIGEYASESRYVIADFNNGDMTKIRTLDLETSKSFDLHLDDIKIMFPNETILLQKLPKDEFEFSINHNIDILEKIEKKRNKSVISESKNIDPDELLKSIEAMEGFDPDNDEDFSVSKKRKKRKI
tara:strand:- start:246 stop:770 length:525 start_codon:yes stop_codon:yes gene_type:complete